jgi:hypothetical protein
MKDMNKQIEEIVQGIYSTYGTGALYKRNRDRTYKDYDGELEKDDADKLYNDIYALIQKEREDAIKGYVKWAWNNGLSGLVDDDSVEEYLSQTKGGKQ